MFNRPQNQIPVKFFGLISLSSICLFAIIFAYVYFQQKLNLAPCPWCIVQRFLFFFMAFHILLLSSRRKFRTFTLSAGIWPLLGLCVSAYHVWIQTQPPSDSICLDGWVVDRGWSFAISQLWTPSGSCTDIGWTLLNQGIPFWTGVVWLGLLSGVLFFAKMKE